MESFKTSKRNSRLIVLQRIEVSNFYLKKIRKLFGRYIFTNFFTRFFLLKTSVGKKYFQIMLKEFLTIKDEIYNQKYSNFLSIGGGVGGLEAIINNKIDVDNFYFIERNFVSKKVKYGWGGTSNNEAYNDVSEQKKFLLDNNLKESQINIYDYDVDELPQKKFDVIISLLSLDYHYDFEIYKDYLQKVSTSKTKIIFDTIRPDYFSKIFKNIKVLDIQSDTVHKSKRILCSDFKD